MNIYGSIVRSAAFSGNKFATFGEDSAKKLYMAAVNNGKIGSSSKVGGNMIKV